MNTPDYLQDIKTERQFRLDGRSVTDTNSINLWNRALKSIKGKDDLQMLNETFQFAKKIKYSHIGMSSEIYFMHPIRTAAFALLCEERDNIDFGIVGLLHNVFELSDMAPEILASVFNESISNQILALTVDRNRQWDHVYKKDYYDRINSNPLSCRIVKIFDKLDNLFVLGLNSDAFTRDNYLAEIRVHILPMAERDLPSVFPYLCKLTDESESIGFLG